MPFPEFTGCIAKNINIKSDLKRQKKKKNHHMLRFWLFERYTLSLKPVNQDLRDFLMIDMLFWEPFLYPIKEHVQYLC